jgi:hypothetical protein
MNENNFKQNNQLLIDILYDSITEYQTFVHARSIFKDKWYNFIVPSVASETLDWKMVEQIIQNEQKNGFELSYYVSQPLVENFQKYFAGIGKNNESESDFYLYAKNKHYDDVQGKFVLIDETTFKEFVSIVTVCFPEWDNNQGYSEYFFNLQNQQAGHIIQNYIYQVNGENVGCCGYLASRAHNLSYLHNTCVLPPFRRRGYFSNMIKFLSNHSVENNIENSFALVDDNGASFKALQKLGFATKHKYYLFDL